MKSEKKVTRKLTERQKQSLCANLRQYRKSHENKLRKMMNEPARKAQEEAFALAHRDDTDEELFWYVKECRRKQGKSMKRENTVGYVCITRRLGNWDAVIGRVCRELRAEAAAQEQ